MSVMIGNMEAEVSHRNTKKSETWDLVILSTGKKLQDMGRLPLESWNNLGNLTLVGETSADFREVAVKRNPTKAEKAAGIEERIPTGETRWTATVNTSDNNGSAVVLTVSLEADDEGIAWKVSAKRPANGQQGRKKVEVSHSLADSLGI